MRTISVLIKKNLIWDKRNMIIIILISLGIPIYITYALQDAGITQGLDFISLLLSSFYCIFLSFSKLGMIEHKYKETAYLTLTPVSRKDIVISKYIYSACIMLISVAGYEIVYFIMSSMHPLSYMSVILVMAADITYLSIYLPLEFKVGYENIKYYFTAVTVLSPFLIGMIGRLNGPRVFHTLLESGSTFLPLLLILSLITIMVSYWFSIRIFEAKDL